MYKIKGMGFRAEEILKRLPQCAIHSVFQKAVNLSTREGNLLTIGRKDMEMGPCTLVSSLDDSISWLDFKLEKGYPVDVTGGGITLLPGLVLAGLPASGIWYPASLKELPLPGCTEKILDRMALIPVQLKQTNGVEGIGPLIPWIARRFFPDGPGPGGCGPVDWGAGILSLYRAVASGDLSAVACRSASLAGLGPGLTPSGDDFLCGLMLAFVITCKAFREPPEKFRDICMTILHSASSLTHTLSRHFLELAAEGLPGETAEEVILYMLGIQEINIEEAVRRMTGWGAFSGFDQLAGILLGIRAALVQCEPRTARAR